jgi:hypothetical protein
LPFQLNNPTWCMGHCCCCCCCQSKRPKSWQKVLEVPKVTIIWGCNEGGV